MKEEPMLKGELRRQSILDAAEKMYFDKGYAAATIDDILSLLDCSKGSLYHHFDSKQDILEHLCRRHAQEAFSAWQHQVYETPLLALNGLLYYSMPFRNGGERLLSLLLPLQNTTEGTAMRCALLDAMETLFLPQVKEYLETLKASGNAYWHMARLPELVWDAHTALYGRLMQCAARLRQGGAAGDVVEHLESARFLWERTLDLPFGSMEIVRADEALQAIHQAVKHVNHLPGEQN